MTLFSDNPGLERMMTQKPTGGRVRRGILGGAVWESAIGN